MVHLFSTPKPETLALPQAPDIIQDVSALPDVDCNLDLTVSAPTRKQQEVNDKWFLTHIELICSPTTAQIIASDENSCHVAAVTQSEGINFSGFTIEQIKTKQSEDSDLILLLSCMSDGKSQSDQGKVDDNNNRSRLVVVEKPMLVEEQVGEEVPLDPQDEEKTPPEAKLAEVPYLQAEMTKLVVTVPEAPQNIEVSPQSGEAADPAYYVCPRSKVEERTWIVSQKDQYCPVRGCPVVTRNVRRHVLAKHLTVMFDSKQEPILMRQRGFHQYRGQMVMVLAQWLTRQEDATYQDLLSRLRQQSRVPSGYPQSGEEMPVFRSVCREMGWPTSAWFGIQPAASITSPVCVLHWRVIAALIHLLPPSKQNIIATEKYNPHGQGVDLENFNARNRQFYQLSTAVLDNLVPAGAEGGSCGPQQKVALQQDEKVEEVVSQQPAGKLALQQEEEVVASQQQEETVVLQQEEVATEQLLVFRGSVYGRQANCHPTNWS
ncbi:unnamed protein product [Mytilus coruscus]|uniref:Uncharacterized protein n=1 Tax=Mytilus coruscus TaxID=42192 RepID=A0A6J8C9J1_MYTCO|nr:unnamed protein product [Mytilus coruscus]